MTRPWRYWLRVVIVIVPASIFAVGGFVGKLWGKYAFAGDHLKQFSDKMMDKLCNWDGPMKGLR